MYAGVGDCATTRTGVTEATSRRAIAIRRMALASKEDSGGDA
jgi:hypothetical protein